MSHPRRDSSEEKRSSNAATSFATVVRAPSPELLILIQEAAIRLGEDQGLISVALVYDASVTNETGKAAWPARTE